MTPKDKGFEALINRTNGKTEIQMDGKNLIFPIAEHEKIAFFIIVDKVSLNIFNFVDQVQEMTLWTFFKPL